MVDAAAEPIVEIDTDGACQGNPGPGGWGVVLRYGQREKLLHAAIAAANGNVVADRRKIPSPISRTGAATGVASAHTRPSSTSGGDD